MTIECDLADRLLCAIRDAAGLPDLVFDGPLRRLSGGFWADLAAFSLRDAPPGWPRDLVARVMPSAAVARKETVVQHGVAAAGFPTPAVRASGGPDSALGRAFLVMDLAPGAPLLPGLTGVSAAAAAARRLALIPELLASCMAQLHALDPRPLRVELSRVSDVPVTVDDLVAALAVTAADYDRGDLADVARWLTGNRPRPSAGAPAEVLCHGDLHPFNLLSSGDQVTVLDWSAALLGPPAYDVALTGLLLAEPPLVVPPPLRPAVRAAGRWLARRFRRRYERLAGAVGAGDLRWHEGVACLRALTEVAGWAYDGSVTGRSVHPWLVTGPALARRLSVLTGVQVRPR